MQNNTARRSPTTLPPALSTAASVAHPLFAGKLVKKTHRQRLTKIAGNLFAVICQHSLPAIALAKALPVDCQQMICQLLPSYAGEICMVHSLQEKFA